MEWHSNVKYGIVRDRNVISFNKCIIIMWRERINLQDIPHSKNHCWAIPANTVGNQEHNKNAGDSKIQQTIWHIGLSKTPTGTLDGRLELNKQTMMEQKNKPSNNYSNVA